MTENIQWKKLKLATWNINGLAKHFQEIKAFILNQYIDILLVSKTHFINKSYLRIPGYILYHTMHPDGKTHGKINLIIKSSIKHYEINKHQRDFLHGTSDITKVWNGCITTSAVYSPLKYVIKSEQYITFLETIGNRFIAAGDYNAKHTQWGSKPTSSRGRELLKAIDTMNLSTVSTGEPIYWSTDSKNISDLPDFGISRSIPKNSCSTESCLDLSSGHSPVIIILNNKVTKEVDHASSIMPRLVLLPRITEYFS